MTTRFGMNRNDSFGSKTGTGNARVIVVIIQHIHCPNMVMKLSMYVGLHNVYTAMDVNLAFCIEGK